MYTDENGERKNAKTLRDDSDDAPMLEIVNHDDD